MTEGAPLNSEPLGLPMGAFGSDVEGAGPKLSISNRFAIDSPSLLIPLPVFPECLNRETSGSGLILQTLSQTESRVTGSPISKRIRNSSGTKVIYYVPLQGNGALLIRGLRG